MNTTLAHKIALDPTPEQRDFFQRAAGTARFTWNWALTEWQERYQKGEKPNGHLLKKSFNALRRVQFPWTYDVHRDATARPFADLQTAFINFWAGRTEYPKFKKKGKCRDSFYVACDKFHVDGKAVTLPKVGPVKMHEALRFEPSSKMCHRCKSVRHTLSLGERIFVCNACGYIDDRDINAAKNINQLGQAMPEVTPVERLSAGLSFGSGETQLVEAGTGRAHICARER